ncbi:hypothetical protein ACH5RR_017651 [Cinchona calisaya]|uniref:Uncharacterized protein n=1 Tax=Cinchona calisaya TaxID=153742 RepID=A0ABD2ZM47_9GENT
MKFPLGKLQKAASAAFVFQVREHFAISSMVLIEFGSSTEGILSSLGCLPADFSKIPDIFDTKMASNEINSIYTVDTNASRKKKEVYKCIGMLIHGLKIVT